ncbi:hypothetical protein ACFW4G_03530 [Paenibacillus lactis]|uniref:hypothetical protein n=1 Tax=Paenibacillus lactis TaxID=228574 RepID=UPI00369F4BAD
MEQAVQKLQDEIAGSQNNPYIQVIGNFLIQHVQANPGCAEKILENGKSIAKSLDAMKSEARKKQSNGMAMLTDAEGYAIVLRYFGIDGQPAAAAPQSAPAQVSPTQDIKPDPAPRFDVKLDDFL